MKALLESISASLKEAAISLYGHKVTGVSPLIASASNTSFGDYQTNLALTLSKPVKEPPREIAAKLVSKLAACGLPVDLDIAGPGFINLRLQKTFVEQQLANIRSDVRLGIPRTANPRKVVIDMSSPNIAKEMHVGHLRSTIIGESLARVFEFLGHDVLRINHLGDWGTQFGMLIAWLKQACPNALTEPDSVNLGDLVLFYKQAKKHFDEDESFQTLSRKEVIRLQSGDRESLRAWQLICDQSRKAFQKIYDLLEIRDMIERGESFYNPMLSRVVADLESSGLAVVDQGAKCVFVDGFTNEQGQPLPLIVQKKDGGYNYATTDLASIRYRVDNDKADELIYVVDAGQAAHFAQVAQVARAAGWIPPEVTVAHVPFGVVQGEDGKKLKTRSGETVRLQDLLNEAIMHAREELEKRLNEENRTEPEEFKSQVATAIGIGAVKYADLSLNRMTNYVFSYKKMLSFQGNTAPYMIYAYVRIQGISRKGGIDFDRLSQDSPVELSDPLELDLAKYLLKFDETLESVVTDCLPNRICEYLFELSQKFNQFYEVCSVLGSKEPFRTSRLLLCHLTAQTLKLGLTLLGISPIERM